MWLSTQPHCSVKELFDDPVAGNPAGCKPARHKESIGKVFACQSDIKPLTLKHKYDKKYLKLATCAVHSTVKNRGAVDISIISDF